MNPILLMGYGFDLADLSVGNAAVQCLLETGQAGDVNLSESVIDEGLLDDKHVKIYAPKEISDVSVIIYLPAVSIVAKRSKTIKIYSVREANDILLKAIKKDLQVLADILGQDSAEIADDDLKKQIKRLAKDINMVDYE